MWNKIVNKVFRGSGCTLVFIIPMEQKDYIILTVPDKPNSSKQKYVSK